MSLSGAVEVAIGLVFTYFVFSSVCSGLNEGFARVVNSRGTQLFKSINALIGDVDLATAFWEHELIAGLSRSRSKVGAQQASQATLTAGIQRKEDGSIDSVVSRNARKALPSYISPTTVVTVMKAVVAAAPASPLHPADPSAPAPRTTGVRAVLASIATDAGDDEQRFQADLEKWFNDAMDRLSGWYKRYVQVILLILAIVVTISFNVNTIRIAQELWRQPTLQAVISQEATKATASQSQGQTTQPPQSFTTDINEAGTLPVGWGSANQPQGGGEWGLTILGWLLTIGALTFGAPFWFDLLTRMNSLRSTGPPAKT